jgi:spore coat protein E
MANLKEIVTKAVIGKTKKRTTEDLSFTTDTKIDNVLGCWIINHQFNGTNVNGKVNIDGSYDLNLWYSYDNNSKTNVLAKTFNYNETINVKLKNAESLNDTNEIIVRSLIAPTVSDVKVNDMIVNLKVDKELGVEVVGDTKVRINVEEDYDDYEEDIDINDKDLNITADYLNDVNQK